MAQSQVRNFDDEDEMSMEDILSSIRRYVADESAKGLDAPSIRSTSQSEFEEDTTPYVHQPSTYGYSSPAPKHSAPNQLRAEAENSAARPEPASSISQSPSRVIRLTGSQEVKSSPAQPSTLEENSPLVSPQAQSATVHSINKLRQNLNQKDSQSQGRGKTVDDFIVDLLRPLVKSWLDQNLPTMVERIVEREIKSLTRS
jgi:cell pole-organizing protein PopZ